MIVLQNAWLAASRCVDCPSKDGLNPSALSGKHPTNGLGQAQMKEIVGATADAVDGQKIPISPGYSIHRRIRYFGWMRSINCAADFSCSTMTSFIMLRVAPTNNLRTALSSSTSKSISVKMIAGAA